MRSKWWEDPNVGEDPIVEEDPNDEGDSNDLGIVEFRWNCTKEINSSQDYVENKTKWMITWWCKVEVVMKDHLWLTELAPPTQDKSLPTVIFFQVQL